MTTEKTNAGEYIAHEQDRALTRKKITLAAGLVYVVGMVLGQNSTTKAYHQLDPSASDGTEVAKAINYDEVDATSADTDGLVTSKLTHVTDEDLTWPDGITDAQKTAAIEQLDAHIIIVQ